MAQTKSIETTKGSAPMRSDEGTSRGVVTGMTGLGLDVAETLVTAVVGVLDAARVEAHRSTGSLIELGQTLAGNAAKAAQAASDQINQAAGTILQQAAKAARERIAGARATIDVVAATAGDALRRPKEPVASA
jgi:hypothetical protein